MAKATSPISAPFSGQADEDETLLDDLALNAEMMEEVDHILTWLRQPGHILQWWGLDESVKPGYCRLFYGPHAPASLIG
jgi:hypothetical protein